MRALVVCALLGVAAPAFADDDDDAPPAPPPAERLTYAVNAGVSWSQFGDNSAGTVAAPYVAAELGYRTSATDAVGVRVEWSRLSGSYDDLDAGTLRYTFQPLFLGAFARGEVYDRLWGEFALGLALDHYADQLTAGWTEGVGIGITGGVDVAVVGGYRLGVFAATEAELEGGSHEGATLGLAVRR